MKNSVHDSYENDQTSTHRYFNALVFDSEFKPIRTDIAFLILLIVKIYYTRKFVEYYR